jgi:hypothetical protein
LSPDGRSVKRAETPARRFALVQRFNRGALRAILLEADLAKGDRMHPLPPRPASTHEAGHKFKLGRNVVLQSTILNRNAARGAYQVTAQLPERDGQLEYRIKSPGEPHERVVKESDLSSA